MRKILTFVILAFGISLSGCSWSLFTVYKIDVQQGNALPEDKIAQLQVGMTPDQVRYLLGYPLVRDIFRTDRWEYVYYFKPGGQKPQVRRVTIFFQSGRVMRIDQPPTDAPSETET